MMSSHQGDDAPGWPARPSLLDSIGPHFSLDLTCILPSKSRAYCILIGAAQVDPMTPAFLGCP